MPMVSLIIPTYNEAKNIPPLLEELSLYFPKGETEYIIVDDNSPDGTAGVVKGLMGTYPIRLIERSGKSGLGSAVRAGFEVAKGDVIGVMDADLSHDPAIVPSMLSAIHAGADIAIGSRFAKESQVEMWAWWRKLTSHFGVWAAKKLTKTEDPLSGFFLMKKEVIAHATLTTTGYKILLEILVKGSYRVVKEFPFTFRMRKYSVSKLNAKEYLLFVSQLARYGFWQVWAKHKIFLCLLFLAFTCISVGLRQSAWLDEGLSWSFAQDTVHDIVYRSLHTDLHPPLFYLLLHALLFVLPPSVTLLRMVSVGAYLLFATLFYSTMCRSYPEERDWKWYAAIALGVFSPFVIHYAGELRSSMIVVTLTLIQWICFERFLLKPSDRRIATFFVFWSVILLFTFYPIVFVLLAELVYAFVKRVSWKHLFIPTGAIIVGYLPWAYALLRVRLGESAAHFLGVPWWQIPAIVLLGFTGGRVGITDLNHLHWYWPSAIIAIAGGVVCICIFFACRYAWDNVRSLVFVSVVAFFFALVVSATKVSLFDPRYHVTLYPLFALLVAHGFIALQRTYQRVALVFFICCAVSYTVTIGLYLFHPLFGREDWRQAVVALGEKTQSGDVVIFYGLEGVEPPPSFRIYQTTPIEVRAIYPNQEITGNTDPMVFTHVKQVLDTHRRVWLTRFLAWQKDPEGIIKSLVESQCIKKDSVGYFKVIFDLYECKS